MRQMCQGCVFSQLGYEHSQVCVAELPRLVQANETEPCPIKLVKKESIKHDGIITIRSEIYGKPS